MNKQELLNELNDIRNTYSGEDNFENGVIIGLGTAIAKIGKLDEPEKVKPLVVPKDLGKIGSHTINRWEANMNKTSGIFAYYIGDFRFPKLTFGNMRFYYNPDTRDFTLAKDADVTYDAETVIEDSDFLLFQEYLDSDGDLCIIQLVKDDLVL